MKWFNAEKGYGFITQGSAKVTYLSTSRPWNDPGPQPSAKGNPSFSMLFKVERDWKQ